ncbi:MAG: hypothetical protein ACR2PL_00060 [Dehalococcoidia bacterium]
MKSWIEGFTTSIEERASRRSVIGRAGRLIVATGAALAGVVRATPVLASCGSGGGCSETQYTGYCTGNPVWSCSSCTSYGWSWYCCDDLHRQWKCQDCCNAYGGYDHTCQIYVGQCGYQPAS